MSRKNMKYLTTKEAAQQWEMSERLVQKYCASGHIEMVEKHSGAWRIPCDAKKPEKIRNIEKAEKKKILKQMLVSILA